MSAIATEPRRALDAARPGGLRVRASANRCAFTGCTRPNDYLLWKGKYYCLEHYEGLRVQAKLLAQTPLAQAAPALPSVRP